MKSGPFPNWQDRGSRRPKQSAGSSGCVGACPVVDTPVSIPTLIFALGVLAVLPPALPIPITPLREREARRARGRKVRESCTARP